MQVDVWRFRSWSEICPLDRGRLLTGTEELRSRGERGVSRDEHPAAVFAESVAVTEGDLGCIVRAGSFAEPAFVVPSRQVAAVQDVYDRLLALMASA